MRTRVTIMIFLCAAGLLGLAAVQGSDRSFDDLAPTPVMGWNSWYCFGDQVSEEVLLETADAMVSSGMKDAGYQYVVIDDIWQKGVVDKKSGEIVVAGRNADGVLLANPDTFPNGLAAVSDYVHRVGLRFGLYTGPGLYTCGGRLGSQGYENQDVASFGRWGVDFIKLDWCSCKGRTDEVLRLWREALDQCERPIVLSVNAGRDYHLLRSIANMWRTTLDIAPVWSYKPDEIQRNPSIRQNIEMQRGLESFNGPGGWNDPDIMQVGCGGLSDNENRSHFSMWAMLSAPLIAGNDIRNMSESVRTILTNREVIAIDQDPLGAMAVKLAEPSPGLQVWVKRLYRPTEGAVALLNHTDKAASMTLDPVMLNLKRGMFLRDLWRHEDLGLFTEAYTVEVPSHGVIMLKLSASEVFNPQVAYARIDPEGTVFEAENPENISSLGTIENQSGGFTGTGYVLGHEQDGSDFRFTYFVSCDRAGLYRLEFRYALGNDVTIPARIEVNELKRKRLPFPSTGGWDQWKTVSYETQLERRVNQIRLYGKGRELNVIALDHLRVVPLSNKAVASSCRDYHVSIHGSDSDDGQASDPLRTISAAAQRAQPGDTITVHEGVYRERINPLRGGESDQKRIVYRAASGENVVIKGSEVIKGWRKLHNDTWQVVIPNSFFGDFNPYSDLIHGDWFNARQRDHHTGAVYLNGHWLTESARLDDVLESTGDTPLWFAQVDSENTTIWAQFKGVDPNASEVEINVRQTVFYPAKAGTNYITVRGFAMMHAATPWSPPTAEQIGLLGTHWSKGWVIDNNDISYSSCVGVTLGKYGDQWDNTSQDTAVGYVKTIERAMENGWSKDNIGHHVVRNNRISHCEQAGLVGSLGGVFSTITGNVIHDIHIRQLFTGHEMAGIKLHAPIDVEISSNHIYRTCRGIWLDWMTQGTRVTGNLLHDNGDQEDLYVEVSHGPFMVDHNIFLSAKSLFDKSQGGAYVHNLMAGRLSRRIDLKRFTPFHKPHNTELAGLQNIQGGDDRFYNNLLIHPADLALYNKSTLPMQTAGNVFLNGAKPGEQETDPLVLGEFDPGIQLVEKPDGYYLQITLDDSWVETHTRQLVTTGLLGNANIPDLPYVKPNGSPYRLDMDYFGGKRNEANPYPGPFELPDGGTKLLKVWLIDLTDCRQ